MTHAQDCGTVAPALTLQMDTTVDGDLAVGGALTVGGSPVLVFQTPTWAGVAEYEAAGLSHKWCYNSDFYVEHEGKNLAG